MKKTIMSLAVALVGLFATARSNATVIFSDNFEARGATGATTIGGGWNMNKEVFTASGDYEGGYYPNPPGTFGPNAIVTGQSGAAQGTYSGKLYPDFDGWSGDWTDDKVVKTTLLFNKKLTAEDIALGEIRMDFDFKTLPLGPNASIVAFAKLLNSNFSQTWYTQSIVLTSADWSSASTWLTFNGSQVNANAQFGFTTISSNYAPATVFMDNVVIASIPEPSVASLLGFGVLGLVATRFRRRS